MGRQKYDRHRKPKIIEIIILRIFQPHIYMYEYLCEQGSARPFKGSTRLSQIASLTSLHSLLPMAWVYSTQTVKRKRDWVTQRQTIFSNARRPLTLLTQICKCVILPSTILEEKRLRTRVVKCGEIKNLQSCHFQLPLMSF